MSGVESTIANNRRYEKYERVDMGDFNWVTPQFLAFASPQHQPVAPIPTTSSRYAALPKNVMEVASSNLPLPFKNVLAHFASRDIGLVVRLNSELYCPTYFTALGINHIDMIFEDGTCPALPVVRKFIKLAHDMIRRKKGIAVHCKAGLGRTGCLIGAYLIYRHGFTANEIIAFMRFMRPGMVVGPQQHWLHLNQGQFREWWFEDTMREKLALTMPATPAKSSKKSHRMVSASQMATPPRAALGEIDQNGPSNSYQDENLPAPTPGQPRKTHRKDSRHHPYSRATSGSFGLENELQEQPESEIISMHSHRHGGISTAESEEEYQLRMLSRRASRSPQSSEKPRAVTYTTTTTTTTAKYDIYEDEADRENVSDSAIAASPSRSSRSSPRGVNGKGEIGVAKTRATPRRAAAGSEKGVRKTSGRVGSAGSGLRVR